MARLALILLLLAFPAGADEPKEDDLALAARELNRRALQIMELRHEVAQLEFELQAERDRKSVRCAIVKPERKS